MNSLSIINIEKPSDCSKFCTTLAVQLEKIKAQLDFVTKRLEALESRQFEGVVEGEEYEVQTFQELSEEQAIVEIEKYVNEHPGALTSDVICDLCLDADLVLQVLDKLQKEGKIRGTTA